MGADNEQFPAKIESLSGLRFTKHVRWCQNLGYCIHRLRDKQKINQFLVEAHDNINKQIFNKLEDCATGLAKIVAHEKSVSELSDLYQYSGWDEKSVSEFSELYQYSGWEWHEDDLHALIIVVLVDYLKQKIDTLDNNGLFKHTTHDALFSTVRKWSWNDRQTRINHLCNALGIRKSIISPRLRFVSALSWCICLAAALFVPIISSNKIAIWLTRILFYLLSLALIAVAVRRAYINKRSGSDKAAFTITVFTHLFPWCFLYILGAAAAYFIQTYHFASTSRISFEFFNVLQLNHIATVVLAMAIATIGFCYALYFRKLESLELQYRTEQSLKFLKITTRKNSPESIFAKIGKRFTIAEKLKPFIFSLCALLLIVNMAAGILLSLRNYHVISLPNIVTSSIIPIFPICTFFALACAIPSLWICTAKSNNIKQGKVTGLAVLGCALSIILSISLLGLTSPLLSAIIVAVSGVSTLSALICGVYVNHKLGAVKMPLVFQSAPKETKQSNSNNFIKNNLKIKLQKTNESKNKHETDPKIDTYVNSKTNTQPNIFDENDTDTDTSRLTDVPSSHIYNVSYITGHADKY